MIRAAQACSARRRALVIGHSAAGGGVRNPVVGHLRVDPPDRLAGRRVERDDDVLGGAGVEQIAGLERRVLGPVELRVIGIGRAGRRYGPPTPFSSLPTLSGLIWVAARSATRRWCRHRRASRRPSRCPRDRSMPGELCAGSAAAAVPPVVPRMREAGDDEDDRERDPARPRSSSRRSRGVSVGITSRAPDQDHQRRNQPRDHRPGVAARFRKSPRSRRG